MGAKKEGFTGNSEHGKADVGSLINAASASEALKEEWRNRGFDERPDLFFSEDSYPWLDTLKPEERCVLLLTASPRMTVTPVMYEIHFRKYPADLKAFAAF